MAPITALISFNCQLGLVGLQLRILNGVVSLLTSRIENRALTTYVSEQSGASANLQLTTGALEVLACIAFRQPISQAEIDQLFDADKRGLVVKLRDLKLVEDFAGFFVVIPFGVGSIGNATWYSSYTREAAVFALRAKIIVSDGVLQSRLSRASHRSVRAGPEEMNLARAATHTVLPWASELQVDLPIPQCGQREIFSYEEVGPDRFHRDADNRMRCPFSWL